MNQDLSDLKTSSIDLILRGTDLYVSNGDLLESTINSHQKHYSCRQVRKDKKVEKDSTDSAEM